MAKDIKQVAEQVFGAEKNAAVAIDEKKLDAYRGIANKMFHTRVLHPRELMCPAIAGFAGNIISGLNTYRTLYFVSVLRIDMSYVAAILSLISIWDALNDPLMGIVYDRTRTRWGKARPYMLFTPFPFYAATALLYSGALIFNNDVTDDPKKIIFLFIVLFAQETFSTIYYIPRNNLPTLMSPNPKDRITLGLVNQYASDFGSGMIYTLFLPIQDLNRWGITNISMPTLFAVLGIFSAIVGTFASMALAFGTKERIMLQRKPAPVIKSLFYLLKNKYALRNFAAEFATSWFSTGGYAWDFVTQLEIIGGAFRTSLVTLPNTIIRNVSIAFVPKIIKHFNGELRRGVLLFRTIDILRSVVQFLVGNKVITKPLWFCLQFSFFWMLNGLDDAPSMVMEQEMEREINDYTEYVTGERPDGTFNLIKNLINKLTAPLGALFTIWVFRWTKYDTTKPMTYFAQGNTLVYRKVYLLYMIGWSLPALVKLIPVFFYDLHGEKREKMYIKLNERRALIAKTDANEELEALAEILRESE